MNDENGIEFAGAMVKALIERYEQSVGNAAVARYQRQVSDAGHEEEKAYLMQQLEQKEEAICLLQSELASCKI